MSNVSILKMSNQSHAQHMLANYLDLNPDVIFLTSMNNKGHAVIDLLKIPQRLRRQGIGTLVYQLWENTLPEGTTIYLFAVDDDASAFWRAQGFDGENNSVMTKVVEQSTRLAA